MTLDCHTARERLGDGELEADRDGDPELRGATTSDLVEHLAGCEACRAVADAFLEIDARLAQLPPIDASDALVHATITRATQSGGDRPPGEVGSHSLLVAAVAAIASALGALLVAPLTLSRWLFRAPRGKLVFGLGGAVAACFALVSTMTWTSSSEVERSATVITTTTPQPTEEFGYFGSIGGNDGIDDDRGGLTLEDESIVSLRGSTSRGMGWAPEAPMPAQQALAESDTAVLSGEHNSEGRDDITRQRTERAGESSEQVTLPLVPSTQDHNGRESDVPSSGRPHRGELRLNVPEDRLAMEGDESNPYGASDVGDLVQDISPARPSRWWAQSQSTEGLAFQPRDGWWANTYVPGDPALRILHTRLASASGVHLASIGLSPLALAETASPAAPTLAAPTDHAVSLGVHADVAAVDGPSRVRVEVALRAIDQAAGRRGALRIAVVIDARHALSTDEQAHIRALLASLGRARGARDRVIVVAAGPRGGTLLPLGTLRHGELEVALRRLFGEDVVSSPEGSVPTITLESAVQSALEAVATDEGAGLVLLATPDAAHDAALDHTLHVGTVAGVTTSAIAIGSAASPRDLDAIALAGHGRRRVITSEADALAAVRAELQAASQLVARALRVRVRLAPGVQLVEVIGSHPLDQIESARTREAEQAIDRDFARRLGIAADRDEDDDGIRILVPSFYAGDAHTVLLDVVVPGPGAIADVDVRFKDLVRVGNGRASAALSIERGAPRRGPQELRVVANVIGREIVSALTDAGDLAEAGDLAGARVRLGEARTRIEEVRAALPTIAHDRSLAGDAALCDRYLAALADPSADRALVATSLHYAARRRVVRPRLAFAED
jgi:hypothetical protein